MLVPTKMNNETYLTSDEAAEMLGYTREWFEKSIVPKYGLKRYQKGVRKRPILYKQTDLEPLVGIRPIEDGQQPPEK